MADTRRLNAKPQDLTDAYGPPSNFLEIDIFNPQTVGMGRARYTSYELRMRVRPSRGPGRAGGGLAGRERGLRGPGRGWRPYEALRLTAVPWELPPARPGRPFGVNLADVQRCGGCGERAAGGALLAGPGRAAVGSAAGARRIELPPKHAPSGLLWCWRCLLSQHDLTAERLSEELGICLFCHNSWFSC